MPKRKRVQLVRVDGPEESARSLLLPEGKRKRRALSGTTHKDVQAAEDKRVAQIERERENRAEEKAIENDEPPMHGVYKYLDGEKVVRAIVCNGKETVLHVDIEQPWLAPSILTVLHNWLDTEFPRRPRIVP